MTTTRRAQEGDILKRARWCESGTASWVLKACAKDGSAVLATVRFAPWSGFFWRAAGKTEHAATVRSAFIMARKALREANK